MLVPAILAVLAAVLAAWLGWLTAAAAGVAAVVGFVVLEFGGLPHAIAVGIGFGITSLLERRRDRIEDRGEDNVRRDVSQVIANTAVLVALVLLRPWAALADAAFLGCLAAVAGDTWGTALGEASGRRARLVTTGEKVPAGTAGAVTSRGVVATAAAGLTVGLAFVVSARLTDTGGCVLALVCAAVAGGVVGPLVDGWLGATWQARFVDRAGRETDRSRDAEGRAHRHVGGFRILTNDAVNFAGSVAGAVAGAAVWWAFS